MSDLAKIKLPDGTYKTVKDAEAREQIATVDEVAAAALNDLAESRVRGIGIKNAETLLENEYEALEEKDPETMYLVEIPEPPMPNYLTFEAATDGVDIVAVAAFDRVAVPIEVSTNGGVTWETKTSSAAGTVLATLNTGETLKVRGTHGTGTRDDDDGDWVNTCALVASDSCYVYGNIMSLVAGSRCDSATSVGDAQLACAFYDYYGTYSGTNAILRHPTKPLLLPATSLADHCYYQMFNMCERLDDAPTLPATTLAASCYASMFNGCTALTQAPELPATTLAESCYSNMFGGCTSLTTAPALPATTLAASCYNYMFSGCSNLSYIKAMFTTTPDSGHTDGWVDGVAANGTFVKNSAATWDVRGVNGIPNNWTVETASS